MKPVIPSSQDVAPIKMNYTGKASEREGTLRSRGRLFLHRRSGTGSTKRMCSFLKEAFKQCDRVSIENISCLILRFRKAEFAHLDFSFALM